MRYAIVGDFHGADLSGLYKVLERENIDVLVSLGDFDQTKTINQFRGLEKKLLSEGISVVTVPGNHDHAVLNNLPGYSRVLYEEGKTIQELHDDLRRDPGAYDYIYDLVTGPHRKSFYLDEGKFGKEYMVITMHGAYAGNLSSYPNCPEYLKDLWYRLDTKEDYERNFGVMRIKEARDRRKRYRIMVRGHDHEPRYAYWDPVRGVKIYEARDGSVFNVFLRRQYPTGEVDRWHVINPGAFYKGYFAVLDTDFPGKKWPVLEFQKLK